MSKFILTVTFMVLFIWITGQEAFGATVWTPAGYWLKEVTGKGSVRFSKMTDTQVKDLCTVTPPQTIISGAINPPVPYTIGTRETSNVFGGFEVLPKLSNGDCFAVQDSKVYDASQVGATITEVLCPAWK